MPTPDLDQKKERREQELRIRQQIAFASGLFQADITIRTLLESLAEGVVVIDNLGTILLVNTQAEQMFGYPNKELIGKPHAILIPERFRKVHEKHEAHFFAAPKIRQMGQLLDLAGCRQDGSEFPVEISLSFIETINGVLVLAFISDISLRKEYELRLRESEELFRIQLECVKDYSIFMLDAQGNILNWNTGAERLKGYQEKEIIGRHFSCFYPEEERIAGKPDADLRKTAAEGRFECNGWRIRKDGSIFWADVIFTAISDENGKLKGFSKVTHDITERKRAEDALDAVYADLQRSNKELELYASVTSHDLQEPLLTISNYTELLAQKYQGKLDPDADKYMHYILDGTNHMHTLINDLLAYSRVGTRAKTFAPVKLDSVLDVALQSLKHSIAESNLKIDRKELPEVEGDDVQLAQLFQNLIGNAIKFRKKDLPSQIRISAERKDNMWVIGVHDNGIGIEPRFFEQIFQIFRRLHTRQAYEGSGVGLAICRKIVEHHQGDIWVESVLGEWTSFYFTIPVQEGSNGA